MKVIDLIIKLQQLPPNKIVVVDLTSINAKAFHFKELANVEEVRVETLGDLVMLSAFEYGDGSDVNDN